MVGEHFHRERNGAPVPSACRGMFKKRLKSPTLSERRYYVYKCNSRRDLLQNPIGTLVGTTAIAAKCEDVSLSENLDMGTRGVLISPSIRCRASHCTINADVCHEVPLLGCGSDPRTSGSDSLEPWREETRSKMLT